MSMIFGKKENKAELPDLPPLPLLPPKQSLSPGAMPQFPDSPEMKPSSGYGEQGMQPPGRRDAYLSGPAPMEEKSVKVVEMQEWHPQNPKYGEPGPVYREHPELQEEEEDESEVSRLPRISESEEERPMISQRPTELRRLPEPRKLYVQQKPMMNVQPSQPADVFVRIDKFHTARKSLSEIQSKLNDIDELVRRIRETKLKEEQELANWEKDLMQIKERVATVSENIFEKVN